MPSKNSLENLLLRARLWWGRKHYEDLGPTVVRVSKSRLIKGPCELSELEALEYVREHTSIPVPKVRRTFSIDGRLYIELEYIQGDRLDDLWDNCLTTEVKQAIMDQISGYVNQLRELKPRQEGVVGSAKFGRCLDSRIGFHPFGPFSIEYFHSFLRGNLPLGDCTKLFGESVTKCHTRSYCTRFCHADLYARNIIVCDGSVVDLIDWQFAGWYPEYWEWTKTYFAFLYVPDWYDMLGRALQKYENELIAERTLWRCLDEPGNMLDGTTRVYPLAS